MLGQRLRGRSQTGAILEVGPADSSPQPAALSQPAAQGRRNQGGAGQWWYLALLMLPALSLCALLLGDALQRRPALRGDAFLDHALPLLDSSLPGTGEMLYSEYGPIPGSADHVSGLASLEGRLADDPRYWLLRFQLGDITGMQSSDSGPLRAAGLQPTVWLLDEATRHQAADGPIRLRLFRYYDAAWRGQAVEALTKLGLLGDQPAAFSASNQPAREKVVREEVWRTHGKELTALRDGLLASAPDEALAHYSAALLAADGGQLDEAWAELRRGNAAPRCSALSGALTDERNAALAQGKVLYSPYVTARLSSIASAFEIPNYGLLRLQANILQHDALARRDPALLTELHRYMRRMGSLDQAPIINSYEWNHQLRDLYTQALREGLIPQDTPRQRRLAAARQVLYEIGRQCRLQHQLNKATPGGQVRLMLNQARDLLSGLPPDVMASMDAALAEATREQQLYAGKLLPLWQQLAAYDDLFGVSPAGPTGR